jgi:hypothetical protein
MKREFIDASTVRIDRVDRNSLGCFEILQNIGNPTQYCFLLRLDSYQSNCQRLWLEYRWRFKSLAGAQFQLHPTTGLQLTLARVFSTEEAALDAFEAWIEGVSEEFEASLSDRA